MAKPSFRVFVESDVDTGALLAVYLQIREGKAATVREYADGAALANYGRRGELLGIELLAPCEIAVLDKIAKSEQEKVRKATKTFLRQAVPRQMVIAS